MSSRRYHRDAIGDLSVLWNFERNVASTEIPMAVNRGAYYFSNLDALFEETREGAITTMFPADLKIPMVAPADLGVAAALRMAAPLDDSGVQFVEGPERYSFDDVAVAFASALGRAVTPPTRLRLKLVQVHVGDVVFVLGFRIGAEQYLDGCPDAGSILPDLGVFCVQPQ
ncbi:uncharacterized protein YbjT (DUF2867 family) [Ensifer sp. KUDG1]